MSVNYHAFQNRGYLFTNHEADAEIWFNKFAGYDPERIARILKLSFDEEYLYFKYYGRNYRLVLADGHLQKETEDSWTDDVFFNEGMAIYHLLTYTKDHPVVSGQWVRSDSLDGVVSRNPNVKDPLLVPFAQRFSGKTEELKNRCEKLGGIPFNQGDVAYEFEAFPFFHIRMAFWDSDEDFPAQAQVLVDQHATDFVHYETVGCILSDLLEMLEADS